MPTEYVVLRSVNDNGYVAEKQVTARSSQAAIREVVNGKEGTGTYVAVPARSFKHVTVTVETRTQLKFQ